MAKSKIKFWLTPDGLNLISDWANKNLSLKEIADNMEVNIKTLKNYSEKYPEINSALTLTKQNLNIEVENALHKKAIGSITTLKRPIKLKRIDYEEGKKVKEEEIIEYASYDEYTPPDTRAGIFWLKNRSSKRWHDNPKPEKAKDNGMLSQIIEAINKED